MVTFSKYNLYANYLTTLISNMLSQGYFLFGEPLSNITLYILFRELGEKFLQVHLLPYNVTNLQHCIYFIQAAFKLNETQSLKENTTVKR